MYAPPHFREDRPAVLLDVLTSLGAATLITPTREDLAATFLPILVTGTADAPVLLAHVARANPQWRDADRSQRALMVASGPNTYISPGWYPSKQIDGQVVPTWNYVHVQAHGMVEWVTDTDEKLAIVTALTDHHEQRRSDRPWAVDDAPADWLKQRLAVIVGLRFRVDRLEGSFKLSQNQPEGNRDNVLQALSISTDERETSVAREMERRPPSP